MVASDPSLAASLAQPAPSGATLATPPQAPELFETIKGRSLAQPDHGTSLDVSRGLAQSVNPGYYLREGNSVKSVSKDDYTLDEEEVRLKSLLLCPCASGRKAHHHQRKK